MTANLGSRASPRALTSTPWRDHSDPWLPEPASLGSGSLYVLDGDPPAVQQPGLFLPDGTWHACPAPPARPFGF